MINHRWKDIEDKLISATFYGSVQLEIELYNFRKRLDTVLLTHGGEGAGGEDNGASHRHPDPHQRNSTLTLASH